MFEAALIAAVCYLLKTYVEGEQFVYRTSNLHAFVYFASFALCMHA